MKWKIPWYFIFVILFALASCNSDDAPAIPDNSASSEETAEPTTVLEIATPTKPPPSAPVASESETAATDTVSESIIVPPTLPAETAVLQPLVEDLTIAAADGLPLHATYYGPGGIAPFPGVILLHMLGGNRGVWADNGFAESLTANGFAVLALDMRGHGDSGSSRDWEQADDDLQRVWAYFVGRDEVDGERTAVIGASIGANMALRTGANEPAIKTVALLSPGLDYRSVTTGDAIIQFGDRPILIAASTEDRYAAESSQTLADSAAGEVELKMYIGAGHGTNMFAPQPDLTDLLLDWLHTHL